ncbi:hypothetical protein ACHAPK_011788, partial [Fusarium culmorum]
WSLWYHHRDRHIEPQASRPKVSPPESIVIRGGWHVWCCAIDPWNQCLRHGANDKEGTSLCPGKGCVPRVRDFPLC